MTACRLLVVRHGETVWNVEQRIQGHQNSALTNRGRRQAELLAQRLASTAISQLYSSDLERAIESLQPLSRRLGISPKLDARLRERNLGVLEGLTAAESRQQQPEAWQGFKSSDPDFVVPGGESPREFQARVRAVVVEVAEHHPGQQVLLMAHGGTLNHVFRICLGLPAGSPRTFSTLNASVNVVDYQSGVFRLETWGDVSHLSPDVSG